MSRWLSVLPLTALIIVLCAGAITTSAAPPPPAAEDQAVPYGETAATAAPEAGPVTTYYKTYSANDFHPRSSRLEYDYVTGGAVYATALSGISTDLDSFVARVELPSGARIVEVKWYLVDNAAAGYLTLALAGYQPTLRDWDNIALLTTEGLPTSPAVQTVTQVVNPPAVVDNVNSGYDFRLTPSQAGDDLQVVGARVGYTIPGSFMPVIGR